MGRRDIESSGHRGTAKGRGRRFVAVLPAAVLSAVLLVVGACSRTVELEPAPGGVPRIRVLLSDAKQSVKVSIPGPYEVFLLDGGSEPERIESGDELRSREVVVRGIDVVVAGLVRAPGTVEFAPVRVPVEVDGRRYRGSVRIRVSPRTGRLRIVNVLDLEGYVRGVVPNEMMARWPSAALMAQAVAARTYALAQKQRRRAGPFDVFATTADQDYRGLDSETERSNRAVARTAGRVLYYRGRVFKAYYHSCCGGSTADPEQQGFTDAAPPLRRVSCGYCTKCPWYRWTEKIRRRDVAARVREKNLVGLTVQGIDLDGRITQVVLHRADGSVRVLPAGRFRELVGLRSTLFDVKRDGRFFVFAGRGSGHGVGMCQWGAKGLADAGKSFGEILNFYYPGAKIAKVY